MCVIAAGSVGEYCGIQHLSTAGAFPGIKGTDKVIKLLGEHAALTTWTLHSNPPDDEIAIMLSIQKEIHHMCQEQQQMEIKSRPCRIK
jgi:hypothetical protein